MSIKNIQNHKNNIIKIKDPRNLEGIKIINSENINNKINKREGFINKNINILNEEKKKIK